MSFNRYFKLHFKSGETDFDGDNDGNDDDDDDDVGNKVDGYHSKWIIYGIFYLVFKKNLPWYL